MHRQDWPSRVPSSVLYPLGGDADSTLRTGDGVLFGLHRALLKRASPMISDMFMLGDAKPCVASDQRSLVSTIGQLICS